MADRTTCTRIDRFEASFVVTPKEQSKKEEDRLTPYQKKFLGNLRKTSNIYRRDANQITAQLRKDEEDKIQRLQDEKNAERLSLPLKHWEKILLGKVLKMPPGDQMGNWHTEIIRKKCFRLKTSGELVASPTASANVSRLAEHLRSTLKASAHASLACGIAQGAPRRATSPYR